MMGSGGIAWLGSTPIEGQTPSHVSANNIPFVPNAKATGVTPEELGALFAISSSYTADQQAETYPQSVASGDPASNGIVLWTRINPTAAASVNDPTLAWQISDVSDFSHTLVSGLASVSSDHDSTVKLPLISNALQPFSRYYYRFIFQGIPSRLGMFNTLPDPSSTPAQINLGYVVCQDYGNGFYTALQHLAQEPVDYVVHLGDYIYETITSKTFQGNPARTVPPFPSGSTTIPQDVNDYRHLYQVYRSDPNQQAVHENFAYIQLWDDHEFANDCHQDYHPDNNSGAITAGTEQPLLRQAANQAWSEYGLANVVFTPSLDWEHSITVYRKLSFGKLADLIVTDERLYRDAPPCGNSALFQRYFSPGCAELHRTNRSMLGANQKQWFLQQMTGSDAIWKLWANEVMLMQLKAAGFIYVDLDQWDGYPAERTQILTALSNAGIRNLVALTGDLHTFLAGYLHKNFDNPFESPVGIELMVGSITSANLAEDIESGIDLPSSPLPAKNFGVPPNLLEPLIRLNNLHIQYWDSSTHGYGVVTLTPANLKCVFKAVTTIREPQADLVTLRTFTVAAGSNHLQQS